jgi:uncharacterized phage infection (PIP) family protein YhgE
MSTIRSLVAIIIAVVQIIAMVSRLNFSDLWAAVTGKFPAADDQ